MATIDSRSCNRNAALGLIGMCIGLACVHAEEMLRDDSRTPVPVGRGEPPAAPASLSSCGEATGAEAPVSFRWPAKGPVTSGFGGRGGKPHRGIDISGRYGTAVRAAAAGTVLFSERKRGYGRVVILKHAGGYETVYAHNQDNFVLEGARVRQGQVIADMGSTGKSTGPHLHFEVRVDDRAVDPLACLPNRTTQRR
jgi:murein DD-endopeptidase MepM/ murein hydrolase activator NlpD